jgi:hypothetical protein
MRAKMRAAMLLGALLIGFTLVCAQEDYTESNEDLDNGKKILTLVCFKLRVKKCALKTSVDGKNFAYYEKVTS